MPTSELTPTRNLRVCGFELTPTGLRQCKAVITFAEYEALGVWLTQTEAAIQWWLGDWVRVGEELFGERAAQAAVLADVQVDTVKQYAWVAERVSATRRDPSLSFSHHREVADLPAVEQGRWLRQAKEGDGGTLWSVDRLRREIKQAKTPQPQEPIWILVSATTHRDAADLIARLQAEHRQARLAAERTTR